MGRAASAPHRESGRVSGEFAKAQTGGAGTRCFSSSQSQNRKIEDEDENEDEICARREDFQV